MRLFYNLGVRGYSFVIRLASLFTPKAKQWIQGRKGWLNKLPETRQNTVWFHCASLGEFDQGIPLMNLLKEKHPDIFLIVTFFSPSGYEHYQKRNHPADFVCYLPSDTPANARKFINRIQPKQVFFVKYEFWSNYIFEVKQSGATLYNVSGIFRPDHRFFKWYGGFFRKTLQKFDHFFVQNEASKQLLNSIAIDNVTITGDSRFDRVIENRKQAKENSIIANFKGNDDLFIIGSSWPAGESILIPWINNYNGKVLIAPHQVDKKHVDEIRGQITRKVSLFTESSPEDIDGDVLILDTIGHLASAYNYGSIAYVGGGFSGSLHNILEPAVFGLPVIFGPKHSRFPEGQQFIDGGFGFSVSTTEEFNSAFNHISSNREVISQKEQAFVEKSAGASEKIYKHISEGTL